MRKILNSAISVSIVGLSLKFHGIVDPAQCGCDRYDEKEINRVARVIEIQKRRYPYLFE